MGKIIILSALIALSACSQAEKACESQVGSRPYAWAWVAGGAIGGAIAESQPETHAWHRKMDECLTEREITSGHTD